MMEESHHLQRGSIGKNYEEISIRFPIANPASHLFQPSLLIPWELLQVQFQKLYFEKRKPLLDHSSYVMNRRVPAVVRSMGCAYPKTPLEIVLSHCQFISLNNFLSHADRANIVPECLKGRVLMYGLPYVRDESAHIS